MTLRSPLLLAVVIVQVLSQPSLAANKRSSKKGPICLEVLSGGKDQKSLPAPGSEPTPRNKPKKDPAMALFEAVGYPNILKESLEAYLATTSDEEAYTYHQRMLKLATLMPELTTSLDAFYAAVTSSFESRFPQILTVRSKTSGSVGVIGERFSDEVYRNIKVARRKFFLELNSSELRKLIEKFHQGQNKYVPDDLTVETEESPIYQLIFKGDPTTVKSPIGQLTAKLFQPAFHPIALGVNGGILFNYQFIEGPNDRARRLLMQWKLLLECERTYFSNHLIEDFVIAHLQQVYLDFQVIDDSGVVYNKGLYNHLEKTSSALGIATTVFHRKFSRYATEAEIKAKIEEDSR